MRKGTKPPAETKRMQPKEMRALLSKEPFEPFRLYLDDGRVFEIRYPRLSLASDLMLLIGWPNPTNPDPLIGEDYVLVDWSQVVKWEPSIPSASA
jgi:hypothetical protein